MVLERVGTGDDQARGVRHVQDVPCGADVAVVYVVPEVLATSNGASALGAPRARYPLADVARSRLGARRDDRSLSISLSVAVLNGIGPTAAGSGVFLGIL